MCRSGLKSSSWKAVERASETQAHSGSHGCEVLMYRRIGIIAAALLALAGCAWLQPTGPVATNRQPGTGARPTAQTTTARPATKPEPDGESEIARHMRDYAKEFEPRTAGPDRANDLGSDDGKVKTFTQRQAKPLDDMPQQLAGRKDAASAKRQAALRRTGQPAGNAQPMLTNPQVGSRTAGVPHAPAN